MGLDLCRVLFFLLNFYEQVFWKVYKCESIYPTFELNSSFCDVLVVVVVVHHKSVRLSHNELTTLFHRRRTFFSEFSNSLSEFSTILGVDIRPFSSVDLLLLLLLFKLLRSIELLVGLITGIFDLETIAFSILFTFFQTDYFDNQQTIVGFKFRGDDKTKNKIVVHRCRRNFVYTPVHACNLKQKKLLDFMSARDVFSIKITGDLFNTIFIYNFVLACSAI